MHGVVSIQGRAIARIMCLELPGEHRGKGLEWGAGVGWAPFFQRTDWLSFAVSTGVALAVYLYTLAPEITVDSAGIYATAGKFSGIGPPPGDPTWAIYAWLFTKILPFSNIALRIGVSSAVAGALTCGTIALMVSRGGALLLKGARKFRPLGAGEEAQLRLVCGVVAGLGFGLNGTFWNVALVDDSLALGMLLMSVVFCLLLRWSHTPYQVPYLYAAAFLYGVTLTARITLVALAPALPLMVVFVRPSLGRNILLPTTVLLGVALFEYKMDLLPELIREAAQFNGLSSIYVVVLVIYAAVSVVLVLRTRKLITQPRTALLTIMLPFVGLTPYFFTAISSMTNPPANWGYARTVQGFIHLLSRGQFQGIMPMNVAANPSAYFQAVITYWYQTSHVLGWMYLAPVLVVLFFLPKIRGRARGWLLGQLAALVTSSFLLIVPLNPPADRGTSSILTLFFQPSYLVLCIMAGYGLAFIGTILARGKEDKARALPADANT